MLGRLSGLSRADARRRALRAARAVRLSDAATKRVAAYSGGMRRRLDLALSFVVAPEILFLDEPTTGLDTRSRRELWDVIRSLADAGTTVFLTTQYLEEADQLADRIAVLDGGRIVATGTAGAAEGAHRRRRRRAARRARRAAPRGARPTDRCSDLRRALDVLDESGAEGLVTLRRPSLDDVFLSAHRARCAPSRLPSSRRSHDRRRAGRARHPSPHRGPHRRGRLRHTQPASLAPRRRVAARCRSCCPSCSCCCSRSCSAARSIRPAATSTTWCPGIILLCAGFGAATTAVYVARDMQAGIIDRFRTMPLRPSAVLSGHVVASLLRNLLATGVVIVRGAARRASARRRASAGWLGAIGIIALYILAITYLFAAIGLAAAQPRGRERLRVHHPVHPVPVERVRAGRDDARLAAVDRRQPAHHADHRDDPGSAHGHPAGRHRAGGRSDGVSRSSRSRSRGARGSSAAKPGGAEKSFRSGCRQGCGIRIEAPIPSESITATDVLHRTRVPNAGMATTEQPHEPSPGQPDDAPTTPLPPAPPLPQQPVYATAPQPQQPVYATAPAGAAPLTAPPAPPARSGSHVGVIIASIVGGLVLLGLAFGAGAVFGWVAGTHHFGRVVAEQGAMVGRRQPLARRGSGLADRTVRVRVSSGRMARSSTTTMTRTDEGRTAASPRRAPTP